MKRNIDDYPPIMNAKQLAEFLGVSVPTAYEVMRQNGFPSFKLINHDRSNVRVVRDEVVKWINSQLGKTGS